jgi:hypothetical protein
MLRYGIFKNFKWADTMLLIWGDECLHQLADLLRDVAHQRCSALRFDDVPWMHSEDGCSVILKLADNARSTQCLVGSGRTASVHCDLIGEDLLRFAEQVDVLAAPDCSAGHQYLDLLGDQPVGLMVSKGEYANGWPGP